MNYTDFIYSNKYDWRALIFFFIFVLIFMKGNKEIVSKNKMEIKLIRYFKHKTKQISYYNYEKDLPRILNYINFLKENYFNNITYYSNNSKPKVSFIASVYNKEKYLGPFISSIQKQDLEEFELIFVDDCSTDKSIDIIGEFQEKDNRIKLIKNKKNMGSLYTRYNGALFSQGDYIIFVDSDDLVLKNGIINTYNQMKKKNLDMAEFNSIFHNNTEHIFISRRYYKFTNIIYQPILSYVYYYRNKEVIELNTALWDKLVKREIVLKSFKYIGSQYLNEKIIIENDVIILFAFFKNSNSFQYIDELGYYYHIQNKDSITGTRYEPYKSNQIVHSIFYNIKYLFDITKNTTFDKALVMYKLKQGYNRYKICFKYIDKEYKLIRNVLNTLLESKYISSENKLIIKNIANEIFIKKTS